MRFELRVNGSARFTDAYTGKEYHKGDILETDDIERVKRIISLKVADLIKADAPSEIKKHGNDIIVYQTVLFCIGGIEEADYNLAKQFRDRKITFVFRSADSEQMLRIAKYCNCRVDDEKEKLKSDVVILASFDSKEYVKDRIEARKIYQQCHADWLGLKSMPMWHGYEWTIPEEVNKVLAVSTTTQNSLLHAFKEPIESELVPNILAPADDNEFRVFLTLSRFTKEKGGETIVRMANRFLDANKSFLWIICGTPDATLLQEFNSNKSILFLPPSVKNQGLIKHADYLVQLSKNESYCYSVHRALEQGTPVIATDIPEMAKVIKDGENGYLVNQKLDNLDIEKIFNKVPQFVAKQEVVAPVWDKVLKGEL